MASIEPTIPDHFHSSSHSAARNWSSIKRSSVPLTHGRLPGTTRKWLAPNSSRFTRHCETGDSYVRFCEVDQTAALSPVSAAIFQLSTIRILYFGLNRDAVSGDTTVTVVSLHSTPNAKPGRLICNNLDLTRRTSHGSFNASTHRTCAKIPEMPLRRHNVRMVGNRTEPGREERPYLGTRGLGALGDRRLRYVVAVAFIAVSWVFRRFGLLSLSLRVLLSSCLGMSFSLDGWYAGRSTTLQPGSGRGSDWAVAVIVSARACRFPPKIRTGVFPVL